MKSCVLFALVAALAGSAVPAAAESGARTYADPKCSARNVDPEKCVIQDGASRSVVHRDAPPSGGGGSPGAQPGRAPAAALTGAPSGAGLGRAK